MLIHVIQGIPKKLKENFMDDACIDTDEISAELWDLKDHQKTFLFHECRENLERVSLRGITWHFFYVTTAEAIERFQNTSIKFVCNAPCLR